MNNSEEVTRAKITYFFKETFRAHSRAEYKEIFSRGLNEDNSGVTGAFPWLYVRTFFALFILFTVNVLILRLTDNTLYIPSVTFLGGITFTVPFIVLLYELYPKRNLSLFMIIAVLVGGGTCAGVLTQLFYMAIKVSNPWLNAVASGCIEELCKFIPAVFAIEMMRRSNNSYAGFLIAACVGAGFSIVEDMGYIFYYSDKLMNYTSDIQSTVILFVERGMTSFCTHILWTGAIGWAYTRFKKQYGVWIVMLIVSAGLHVLWDLPLEGWWQVADIAFCVIAAASINITIVHISRMRTLASEVDLTKMNEQIIFEAKQMGERMRFTNAANLTFALTCTLLSILVLLLCSLPIGIEYKRVEYSDKDAFIEYIEDGFNLKADFTRSMKNPYNPDYNYEERKIDGQLTYVVQRDKIDGYDGVYYYNYYVTSGILDSISVELERNGTTSRYYCKEYKFGDRSYWVFEVNVYDVYTYTCHEDGSITAIQTADDFEGYSYLIALCATGTAIALGCNVILLAFRIKLRREENEI